MLVPSNRQVSFLSIVMITQGSTMEMTVPLEPFSLARPAGKMGLFPGISILEDSPTWLPLHSWHGLGGLLS